MITFVDVFTGVLLEMSARYADAFFLAVYVYDELAALDDRYLKLRNLLCLWQIGIKIIFSIENGFFIYFSVYGRAKADRLFYGFFI